MRRMMTALATLLLAFALLPAQALAEEWVPAPLDGDPFAEMWGVEQGEAPLAATDEEAPEGATQIKAFTMSRINSTLVANQVYWTGANVDKSDPNYENITIAYEYWLFRTNGPNTTTEGYFPLVAGVPGGNTGFARVLPTPDEVPLGKNKFYFAIDITVPLEFTLANTVTMSYLGKTYTGRVIYSHSAPGINDYLLVFDNLTSSVTYPAPLYRMYNTKTSEHLWTRNKAEYDSAGSGSYADWKAEGVAWYVPTSSSKPVYRLYNTKSGDHHYTTSLVEKEKLLASGEWRDEGIAFYSATKFDTNTIKIYRVYNGRLKRGQHHYTKSAAERDSLVKNNGWKDEGVSFYGYKTATPPKAQPQS